MLRRPSVLVIVILLTAGCGDVSRSGARDAGGTLVISTGGDADVLLPSITDQIVSQQIGSQIFEKLASLGPELNTVGDAGFSPALAEGWEWGRDSLSVAFRVDPDARWHDGRPVRAEDVRFSYELIVDSATASPLRSFMTNVDSVTVPDSLTAVVWFAERKPEQFYEFVYNLPIVPAHLLRDLDRAQLRTSEFARNPIGSGPFRFARWVPRERVEIVADTTYRNGRPPLDRIVWTTAPDPNTAATRVLTGEADWIEIVRGPHLEQASSNPEIQLIPYPTLQYGYLGFNFRDPRDTSRAHPILGEWGVRQALSMAVDRQALVTNVFDSLAHVALGPFARGVNPEAEALEQIPYDTARARALLDSLGWRDTDGDGIRDKSGRRLALGILVPTSSAPRMSYAVLLQEQWKRIGVQANVESMEFASFLERYRAGRFDAAIGFWQSDPSPGSVSATWGSVGQHGALNWGRYANPRFDALVDSAMASWDRRQQRALFARAYQLIIDDAPAIWLYEPQQIAAAHRRLRVTGLRPDGWFANLSQWSIPAEQRIRRDSIGLRVAVE